MSTQDSHGFSHLRFRPRHDEWQNAKAFGKIDDGLRLPAKKMIVQIAPVLITLDMAQVCKMKRLTMDHGMQLNISLEHLIDMYGQMRIELAGYTLKLTVRGSEHPRTASIFFHQNASQVSDWLLLNIAQTAA